MLRSCHTLKYMITDAPVYMCYQGGGGRGGHGLRRTICAVIHTKIRQSCGLGLCQFKKRRTMRWFYYIRITKGDSQGKICHTKSMMHKKPIKLSKWTHIMCHWGKWYIRKDIWSVTSRISEETHAIKQAFTQTNTIDTDHTLTNNLNPVDDEQKPQRAQFPWIA